MAINILDTAIANRISAGEVVEKPASIVKELLDNALDAGATEINIDIVNGGIDLIAIRDNGCGIEPDDIKKAFLPHATSKISSIDDLDNIATLGFRGEALASISSVAQVSLVSKTKDLDYASTISVNGGVFGQVGATASQDGTYIEVRNLFYNTPARRKFLRRPKSEENEITNYISRYILAHPTIKLKYTANEQVIFDNKGSNLLDAISCIYGPEVISNIEPIEYESGYLKISGYVGKISYTKPNTTYQTLLVNGRYIIDEGISKAVYSAYEEFLMSRQFPFYVINLTMPYDQVDVNVHPNKLNVKFTHPNEMYDVFYRAVRQTIYNSLNPTKPNECLGGCGDVNYRDSNPIIDTYKQNIEKIIVPKDDEVELPPVNTIYHHVDFDTIRFEKLVPSRNASMFDKDIELKSSEEHPSYQSINNFTDYKIIGELFNEFLILEKDDVMLMVDFHAGHERLLYDKLVAQINAKAIDVQTLLVPYYHSLNVQEMEYITHLIDKLKEFGFEVEPFGPNEIRVLTVPIMLSDINLKQFVQDLLHDMNNQKPKINDELDKMLAQKACKSAVKAGMSLDISQIQELLKNLDINRPVLLCPHGRPIVSIIKRNQIEKWFKRIV
ncbi:MAG: DNA mismatch repair endonuclease MutL [Clostridia bacterium]|nr:DNA mismatch repair endonuclease MutL [Clostridia bacterium]